MSSFRSDANEFLANYPKRANDAELLGGKVVARSEDSLGNNMLRGNIFFAFKDAIKSSGIDYNLYTYGALVRINVQTVRMPDSVVQTFGFGRARVVDAPFIVTDIKFDHLSKGEMQQRLEDYFSVASIQHYVVVDPDKRIIFHHERSAAKILMHIVRAGNVSFGADGLAISYGSIFAKVTADGH